MLERRTAAARELDRRVLLRSARRSATRNAPVIRRSRRSKSYALTDSGRDVARQLTVTHEEDPPTAILRLLEEKPRSAAYLAGKVPTCETGIEAVNKA